MMKRVTLFLLACLLMSACGTSPTPTDSPTEAPELTPLVMPLPFRPDVQFAPFYVAASKGYFVEDAGFDVSFDYRDETTVLEQVAVDNIPFGVVSGEQVLLSRAHDRDVVYVFAWYHDFPVGVVAPEDEALSEPADLAGKTVGVPGRYGASYIGLNALLHAAGLSEADIDLREIGWAAPEAILSGRVQAAMVYIANEPAQIRAEGVEVSVVPVADYADLVSNGLITNGKRIAEDADMVRGFVRAFQRGLADTIADPEAALEICRDYIDTLNDDNVDLARGVLENSIKLWESDRLGATSPEAWATMLETLDRMGLIDPADVALDEAYTDAFIP